MSERLEFTAISFELSVPGRIMRSENGIVIASIFESGRFIRLTFGIYIDIFLIKIFERCTELNFLFFFVLKMHLKFKYVMKLSLLPNSRLLSGIIKTKESLLKTSKIFKQKGKIFKNIFFC